MADLAHVLWAANQGCLGFHPWPYRAVRPGRHRRAAHRPRPVARRRLRDGPGGGRRGARRSSTEVGITRRSRRPPATAACTSTCASSRAGTPTAPARRPSPSPGRWSERRPELITGQWWKEQRGARIFIDFNQNAPHKTVFGAWCVRARVGAQVSTPFRWDELPAIHPDQLTMATVPDPARRATAIRGRPSTTRRSRSSRSSPATATDLARGVPDAPWPPVYPKMPDEARRVNPSRARPD